MKTIHKIAGSALFTITSLVAARSGFADTSANPAAPCQSCPSAFSDPRESPFTHREYIASVEPYKVSRTVGKHTLTFVQGATIRLRAAPGLTAEWLQQYVNQHLAKMGSMPPANMGWCPLTVAGASASVASTGDGFAVTVFSSDRDSAQEILRRAEQLVVR